jgi:predicted AlkP superfamily phosphohydrolase/phosphomutase
VVFTGTDRVQHLYWVFADPDNPKYDPEKAQRYGDVIHQFWIEQDAVLGELFAAVKPNTAVMVFSDHGFGPIRKSLRVLGHLVEECGFTVQEALTVYCLDRSDACRLYIRQRGRSGEARGLLRAQVEELRKRVIEALREARDPETGELVTDAVYAREEVFIGPYAEKGPEIAVVPSHGYFMNLGLETDSTIINETIGPVMSTISGWHEMNGLYAMKGRGILPGRRDRSPDGRLYSLLSVAPTLLYLMGEPIPVGLDGNVMEGAVDPELLRNHPPRSRPALDEEIRELTPEEEEQLKNLPYIGG